MNDKRRLLLGCVALVLVLLAGGLLDQAAAQTKPEGEMRWTLYVTLSPVWFDPGEVVGQLTPFWVLYAMHDALVKPMPGNHMTPSLPESWTVSPKLKMRPMERAAYFSALQTKKLKGLCVCSSALYGNAASRMSEIYPTEGAYAYGGYPDVDALYKQQARQTDRKKREALLHQIQQIMNERVRIAPIFDYIWPSGIGPRVAEPALMMINPYPWSAPLEDVRLKKS